MKQNYLLALLSAFILWLAWPPIPYSSPLLLVGFLPLLIAIENIIRGDFKNKGKKVFLTAFLTGFLWNTASIYWVFNSLNAFLSVGVSLLIALIPFALAPLLMALAFRLYYQLRKKQSVIISFVGLVCFWIAYEYLHQSWDLAFPWMTLGNGFANFHQLIQWYSITGVYGGTLWIWLCNILIFLTYWQYKHHIQVYSQKVLLASSLGLILIPSVGSIIVYLNYQEHLNPSQVVVVQPNIDPYEKFGSVSPDEQLDILIHLSKTQAKVNTEFFIWPETAISERRGINEQDFRAYPSYNKIVDFLKQYKNGSVISGLESYAIYPDKKTFTSREFGHQFIDNFNSSTLIDGSTKLQYYHKSKLVPGVEQLPFGHILAFMTPLFKHFGGTTGGYGKDTEPKVLYAQSGIGAAPTICYESIWGNYVSQYVKNGAQFIAVLTNDGWWKNTSGKDQHMAYAKLRAIENRRWVARSANTGISGFINQKGDIVQHTSWWVPAALSQKINLNEELTFYTMYGDLIAIACLMGAALSFILILVPKRKK